MNKLETYDVFFDSVNNTHKRIVAGEHSVSFIIIDKEFDMHEVVITSDSGLQMIFLQWGLGFTQDWWALNEAPRTSSTRVGFQSDLCGSKKPLKS